MPRFGPGNIAQFADPSTHIAPVGDCSYLFTYHHNLVSET
jgi:hypothetical protein